MPSISDARLQFSAGRLDEAAAQCRAALAQDFTNVHALHLLGLILLRQGSTGEAISLLAAAADQSGDPTIVHDLNHALGVADGAALNPAAVPATVSATPSATALSDARDCYELGRLVLEHGSLPAAIDAFRRAITLQPDFPEAFLELGNALLAQSDVAEAESCYRTATELRPDYADAWNNLGTAIIKQNRFADAAAVFRQGLEHRPDMPELWFGAGMAALDSKDHAVAEDCFRSAIAVRPDYVEALNNLGVVLLNRENPAAAVQIFRHGLEIQPNSTELRLGLGNALAASHDFVAAEQCCRIALSAGPNAALLADLGSALVAQHRLQEGLEALRASVQLDSSHAESRCTLALASLLAGDFAEGWRAYEARRTSDWEDGYASAGVRRWQDGTTLAGTRVLLTAEQGLGDIVQFARYAPMLAGHAVQVVLQLPPPLQPIFSDMTSVDRLIAPGDPAPDCDIAMPLLSLPLYFGTDPDSIPCAVPYVSVPPDRHLRWQRWLGPRRGRRIGLVVSGNAANKSDWQRSIEHPADLAPLLEPALPDCTFVLLQPELRPEMQAALTEWPNVLWPGPLLQDFADTAALLLELDLLITVDTAVAHVAGALGCKVCLMLPFNPDWRWMLERCDSPWYPTITLYRQPKPGDWASVAQAVRRDLTETASGDSDEAVTAHAGSPAPYLTFATALQARGETAEAIGVLRRAVALWPESAEAWFALGCVLASPDDLPEAESCYRHAVARSPRFVEALNNLGNTLLALRRPEEAADYYRAAVSNRAEAPELWLGLANALIECEDPVEAEACFRHAVALRPTYFQGLNGLGNALLAQHRGEEALAAYQAARALRPDEPELLLGFGNALLETGDVAAAEQAFRAVGAMRPALTDAVKNLGNALAAQHRIAEALDAYAAAVRLDPADCDHHNNYALTLLLDAQFEAGWREHEYRRINHRRRRDYERRPEIPRWQHGMSLRGRRVLVMMEQGYGDQIQFLRYLPMLAAADAHVTVEVPRGLQPVFAGLRNTVTVIAPEDAAPDCDIVCPLMSLPFYFGTLLGSIPARVPYAIAPAERCAVWQDWLGPPRGRRIGLVCSGKPSYGLDRRRSIPMAALASLFDVAGCEFVLLQQEVRERDEALLTSRPALRWPGAALRDFGDTAALVASMDLVISVDTAVAHLCGAMGRPVWTMLPFLPDWRWMLHRGDSPWYPTMTLYRQQRRDDWSAVIAAVVQDLRGLAASSGHSPHNGSLL